MVISFHTSCIQGEKRLGKARAKQSVRQSERKTTSSGMGVAEETKQKNQFRNETRAASFQAQRGKINQLIGTSVPADSTRQGRLGMVFTR